MRQKNGPNQCWTLHVRWFAEKCARNSPNPSPSQEYLLHPVVKVLVGLEVHGDLGCERRKCAGGRLWPVGWGFPLSPFRLGFSTAEGCEHRISMGRTVNHHHPSRTVSKGPKCVQGRISGAWGERKGKGRRTQVGAPLPTYILASVSKKATTFSSTTRIGCEASRLRKR